jgi:hypothetical protein
MAVTAAVRALKPFLGLAAALALAACARTPGVDPDDIVSASVAGKPVAPSDVAVLKSWIRQHRTGWETNLNSPPLGCAVLLRGASDEFELIFFPGPAEAAPSNWWRTVLLGRLSSSKGPLIGFFGPRDLAPLFQLARTYRPAGPRGSCG